MRRFSDVPSARLTGSSLSERSATDDEFPVSEVVVTPASLTTPSTGDKFDVTVRRRESTRVQLSSCSTVTGFGVELFRLDACGVPLPGVPTFFPFLFFDMVTFTGAGESVSIRPDAASKSPGITAGAETTSGFSFVAASDEDATFPVCFFFFFFVALGSMQPLAR